MSITHGTTSDGNNTPNNAELGLLLLHALPLDNRMWAHCMNILPSSTYAPTLYGLGETIGEWAEAVLLLPINKRLVVVGCSVGASCALEIAVAAPDRVAALILIGCKAEHNPDADLHTTAIGLLDDHHIHQAWDAYWRPLFSKHTDVSIVEEARGNALCQAPGHLENGVTVFHTRPSRHQFAAQTDTPIVVVTGEEDVAPGVEKSSMLSTSAKKGELHIIPQCGHYVPIEKPDAVKAIIEATIKKACS